MRIIGTLHNRRGDPLLLLSLLKAMSAKHKAKSLGVAWSVPSGDIEPSWEELVREERQIQETLRSCVQMVHDTGLSWDAKSFLGRCYRSFQYEYMVCLNLKRRSKNLRIILLDEPAVRDVRYKEIGNPEEFLREVGTYPLQEQGEVLRSRYTQYKTAYQSIDRYEDMVVNPNSALLEISLEMSKFTGSREEYIANVIGESRPDIVLLRLIHLLTDPPLGLKKLGLVTGDGLLERLGLSGSDAMKLSEAERIVGPLPERD